MLQWFCNHPFSGWPQDRKPFGIVGVLLVVYFVFGVANANASTDEERGKLFERGKAKIAAASPSAASTIETNKWIFARSFEKRLLKLGANVDEISSAKVGPHAGAMVIL